MPTKTKQKPALLAPVSPPPDPLPPPPYLSADAAQLWRETVGHLAVRGQVDPADATTLETFVAATMRQRRIMLAIEAEPLVTDGKISPLLRVAEATAATVKNLAHVLGLNPTARRRLPKAPEKRGGGKWDDLG
jgi:P27 family predicted phage terminase small subunit